MTSMVDVSIPQFLSHLLVAGLTRPRQPFNNRVMDHLKATIRDLLLHQGTSRMVVVVQGIDRLHRTTTPIAGTGTGKGKGTATEKGTLLSRTPGTRVGAECVETHRSVPTFHARLPLEAPPSRLVFPGDLAGRTTHTLTVLVAPTMDACCLHKILAHLQGIV